MFEEESQCEYNDGEVIFMTKSSDSNLEVDDMTSYRKVS